MFPFDYTEYPQQAFLPNLHSSPCNFSHERLNPFHHQNYIPHQMGIFLPQTVLNQDLNSNTITQDGCPFPYNPSAAYEFTCNNQASLGLSSSKKDRHTKISTAHGVRDRRVRLSMAIAREFFDLQDMLGFDKASKTIGWLLSKSKAAIQELVLTKRDSGLSRSNSMYDSQEEDAIASSAMMRMATTTRKRSGSDTFASANSSQEEIERFSVENQANSVVARENRTKARARARERTKEKLSTMANPNQFDDLGFQTSCSSHLLPGFKSQDFFRPLHLTEKEGCSSDLQNLNGLNTTKADRDGSTRVNHLPNLLLGSNFNDGANAITSSSFSGWNIFSSPAEMHMSTVKPWDNHGQKQHR